MHLLYKDWQNSKSNWKEKSGRTLQMSQLTEQEHDTAPQAKNMIIVLAAA